MGYFSCCRRKSAVLISNSHPTTTSAATITTTPAATTTTTTTKTNLRLFHHDELQSATSNFSPSSLLGRGSHSSVFLASLDSGRLLAAAKLPSSPSEIQILSSLPPSPHLVSLLGHTPSTSPTLIAVLDLMPLGSLHHLLHLQNPPPPWPLRFRLSLHSSLALSSLHSLLPPVLHRDIKPSNLLLDSLGRARLADFGLSVRSGSLAPPAGTMGYLDPAYLSPSDLSTKTDVFSFGVLLLEIMTGREAIDVAHSPPSLLDWAEPLIRDGRFDELCDPRIGPVLDRTVSRDLAILAGRCVGSAAEERPEMGEVVDCLRELDLRISSSSPRIRTWGCLVKRMRSRNTLRNRKVSDVST